MDPRSERYLLESYVFYHTYHMIYFYSFSLFRFLSIPIIIITAIHVSKLYGICNVGNRVFVDHIRASASTIRVISVSSIIRLPDIQLSFLCVDTGTRTLISWLEARRDKPLTLYRRLFSPNVWIR